MGLLESFQDPGLEVDLSLSVEDISAREVERLTAAVAVVLVTSLIPRRLSDGSREELALDKRRARRVLHVQRQSLTAWGGTEREPTEDERSAGAQLAWDDWREQQQVTVQARLRYVATWAKRSGNLRFGKSAVTRLKQELEWLDYALRD